MRAMFGMLRKLMGDQRAATAVEYGLILSLVVLAVMGAMLALASETTSMWNNVSDKVSNPG